jgi:diacylglycerol O-acyltransferase / wax synthase
VADRLSASDSAFLYVEGPTTPMHVGSLTLFQEQPGVLDHERLVKLIRDRIAYVPRYRQRLREVPGRLASPVWVDDERFDVTFHVRRSALPAPGTLRQLNDLVARIMSRPLDRRHPLWEVYLVEGVEGNRFALLSKTHQAMVDGITAVDLGEVILEDSDQVRGAPVTTWRPAPGPSSVELVAGALGDVVGHPTALVDVVRGGMGSARDAVGDVVATVVAALRPQTINPLMVDVGQQRRFTTVDLRLDDLRTVRQARGGTINDVAISVVSGALRSWLLSRGVPVTHETVVRTLVPMSVAGDTETTSHVGAFTLDLPVGEADPIMRLQRVAFDTARFQETARPVGAKAMVNLVGFAPPTLHTLGARVGASLSDRAYSLTVTNVPGPQNPLYAGGARMLAAYPIIPLTPRHALSIGLTSYDGGVFLGLNADRDAMPDLDVLAHAIRESLTELVEATRGPRRLTVAE